MHEFAIVADYADAAVLCEAAKELAMPVDSRTQAGPTQNSPHG